MNPPPQVTKNPLKPLFFPPIHPPLLCSFPLNINFFYSIISTHTTHTPTGDGGVTALLMRAHGDKQAPCALSHTQTHTQFCLFAQGGTPCGSVHGSTLQGAL